MHDQVPTTEQPLDDIQMKRFETEIALYAKLSHPNICKTVMKDIV